MKKICVYSHKGGIGKTTLSYKLGIELAENGQRVLLVDGDPQCNLSMLFLGGKWEMFYANDEPTFYLALQPVFHARATPLRPSPTAEHHDYSNLHLLPGHMHMSKFDLSLDLAQNTTFSTFGNLPGAVQFVIEETAKSLDAEYVIIDTSPSISSFNLNYWYSSHYFIVPCNNTIFSDMALESLSEILPAWKVKGDRIAMRSIEGDYTYKFSQSIPKFLGFAATHGHRHFLPNLSAKYLIESMENNDLLLENDRYMKVLGNDNYELDYEDLAQNVIDLTNI